MCYKMDGIDDALLDVGCESDLSPESRKVLSVMGWGLEDAQLNYRHIMSMRRVRTAGRGVQYELPEDALMRSLTEGTIDPKTYARLLVAYAVNQFEVLAAPENDGGSFGKLRSAIAYSCLEKAKSRFPLLETIEQ